MIHRKTVSLFLIHCFCILLVLKDFLFMTFFDFFYNYIFHFIVVLFVPHMWGTQAGSHLWKSAGTGAVTKEAMGFLLTGVIME